MVLEGTTHYYICIKGNENIFYVDLSDDSLILIVRYNPGDSIKFQYKDEGGLNPVKTLE